MHTISQLIDLCNCDVEHNLQFNLYLLFNVIFRILDLQLLFLDSV